MDFWTSREPREVVKCHLNYVVPDTQKWEQAAAYYIDSHAAVDAFVKNSGLGFAIPYLHNGQMHDYMPDFIIRLKTEPPVHLILETKGYDPLEEVKKAAAERWVDAVNATAPMVGGLTSSPRRRPRWLRKSQKLSKRFQRAKRDRRRLSNLSFEYRKAITCQKLA